MILRPCKSPTMHAKQMNFLADPNLCTAETLNVIIRLAKQRSPTLSNEDIVMKLLNFEIAFEDLWLMVDLNDNLPKEFLEHRPMALQ